MNEKSKGVRKGWAASAQKIAAEQEIEIQPLKMPKPLVQRVRDSEAKSLESGAERLPGGLLKPNVAQALKELLDAGYATGKTAVISRAILEARKRLKK